MIQRWVASALLEASGGFEATATCAISSLPLDALAPRELGVEQVALLTRAWCWRRPRRAGANPVGD